MQCVILAGGLGTRVAPLSDKIPKALIEVNGVPFIHYQLTWLSQQDITDVVICIGHLGYLIKDYVQDGSPWNLSVSYVDEGENLMGTAGALRLGIEQGKLKDDFIVIYGDSLLTLNISNVCDYYHQSQMAAVMTVYKNEGKFDKSNIIMRDDNIVLYDKNLVNPPYIDYGFSVLNTKLLTEYVPKDKRHDLSTVFHEASLDRLIKGYEVYDRFFEIGSFEGIRDFETWLNNGKP